MEHLEGALVIQALSGPMVQCTDIRSELLVRQYRKVGAFWKVLSQQAIGIFIGAAFPGVVRMGKEDLQAQAPFELGRTSEFTAIVQRKSVAFGGG